MANVVLASATNNPEIDGLLAGVRWIGTVSYSFPNSPNDYSMNYYGNGEATAVGFSQVPPVVQQAMNYAVSLVSNYTNLTIQFAGTDSADIMVAQSPVANPTAYAYYPVSVPAGGDIWFGTQYNYSLSALGNYYFFTSVHELGHALGLKHSHETGGVSSVAVPTSHDSHEFTVMTYRSFMSGPVTGYTNEGYGYPQTFMANDILALQSLYGADYSTHSDNTVYTWSPTTGQGFINGMAQLAPGNGAGGGANRIFETIWDGNGIDTFDLSNYSVGSTINLNPGASSITDAAQLAYLGNGRYASGNVYNAYLVNSDARSYIDHAIGGSGNDTLIGNAISNHLNGGTGNDTLVGGGSNDTIVGGLGADTAVFSGNVASYLVIYNSATQTFTVTDRRSGSPDGTDTVSGVESFRFASGTYSSTQVAIPPVVIEAFGSTGLVQVGNNYFLNSISSESGPALHCYGSLVVVGQFGAWTPIGAEQTSGGYQVVLRNGAADSYIVWSTDSGGNYITNTAPASGMNAAMTSLEVRFGQDLNSNGTIGVPLVSGTAIEAFGSTSLVQAGNNYFLISISSGSGPALHCYGSPVEVGQFGAWTPIGTEQTSSGYQVVLRNGAADSYIVWSTDSSGNYITNTAPASGMSAAMMSLEVRFGQDLNGNGTIGSPLVSGTVIEAFGSTSLVQAGNSYFLNSISSGSGPALHCYGSPVVVGQFGAWTPIGTEQTSSGYQVVLRNGATDSYIVWSTDSSGNYITNTAPASGMSAEMTSLEVRFDQDLNYDGTIGALPHQAVSETSLYNTSHLDMFTSSDTFLFVSDLS